MQTLFIICETCFCCELCNNQMKCTIIKSKNICENCEKKQEEIKRQQIILENKKKVDIKRQQIIKEKQQFRHKWKNSSPIKKLEFYGKEKLLKLAIIKNIKGRSNMDKKELIKNLAPIVSHNDFPIK